MKPNIRFLFYALFLVLVGLSLFYVDILHKSWIDESFFLNVVKNIKAGAGYKNDFSEWRGTSPKIYGPTFFYLGYYLSLVTGMVPSLLRILSGLFYYFTLVFFLKTFGKTFGYSITLISLLIAFFDPNLNMVFFNGRMETTAIFFSLLSFYFFYLMVVSENQSLKWRYSFICVLFLLVGAFTTPRILIIYFGFGISYVLVFYPYFVKNIKQVLFIFFVSALIYFSTFLWFFNGVENLIYTIKELSKSFVNDAAKVPVIYEKYYQYLMLFGIISNGIYYYFNQAYKRFFAFLYFGVLLYSFLIAAIFTEIGIYYTLYLPLFLFATVLQVFYLVFKLYQQNNIKLSISILLLFSLPISYKTGATSFFQINRVYQESLALKELHLQENKLLEYGLKYNRVAGPSAFYTMFLNNNFEYVDYERASEPDLDFIASTFKPDLLILDEELRFRQPKNYNRLMNMPAYRCIDTIQFTYNSSVPIDTTKFGYWLNENKLIVFIKR